MMSLDLYLVLDQDNFAWCKNGGDEINSITKRHIYTKKQADVFLEYLNKEVVTKNFLSFRIVPLEVNI